MAFRDLGNGLHTTKALSFAQYRFVLSHTQFSLQWHRVLTDITKIPDQQRQKAVKLRYFATILVAKYQRSRHGCEQIKTYKRRKHTVVKLAKATSRLSGAFILAMSGAAWASDTDDAFEKIYQTEWEWRHSQHTADEDSISTSVPDSLPDVSLPEQARKLAYWQDVMGKLNGLDLNDLSDENQINYEIYKYQISTLITDQEFKTFEKPLLGDTSFWGNIKYQADQRMYSEADYRNYIKWLNDMPRYFDQQISNMKLGLARQFTLPKISLNGREQTIISVTDAPSVEDNVYYRPFTRFPATFSEALKAELSKAGKAAIESSVIPAHEALLSFMVDDYIPGSIESLAAYDLPDGKSYYQTRIKKYTTLDWSAEKIHEIGLQEVAKIRDRMHKIMQEVEFKGDLKAFLDFLRTDPQFYVTKPQDLLDRAAWTAKEFDAVASDYFGRLPRNRFAIVKVPDDIAPYYTAGRGGKSTYWVNTYNLPARPLYSLPALTLHESAPGHSFQISMASENDDLPDFRRNTYISAYGEGWALYTEKLGEEMGMYHTPYEIFGMLSYQMWRACRLVVDTGIHAKGWTRKQAQDFMAENTALSIHEVTTEVDRYIAWPGQALSYYLGQMAIEAGRAKAEKALGSDFDIRAFHDMILKLGSVPLSVLDQQIDKFIADGGRSPYAKG